MTDRNDVFLLITVDMVTLNSYTGTFQC